MSKITCVDISEFQQGINFNKMKNDGIKAVIIRAGYGKKTICLKAILEMQKTQI